MLLRLGTRGSQLAQWQARWVAEKLHALGVEVQLVPVKTRGDTDQRGSVAKLGGSGVFTKEIQQAVLEGSVDLAVHSLKDLPTTPVAGLRLAAVPPRGPVADVVVSRSGLPLQALPLRSTVGTGSFRRRAQLLYLFPHLVPKEIRGNVDTRLRKLEQGQYDAILLAEAGMERLGLSGRITERLGGAFFLPAPGQGALAVEIRQDDPAISAVVSRLNDYESRAAVEAERFLLVALGGGCLAPIAALAVPRGDRLILAGRVLSADGRRRIDVTLSGPISAAEELGRRVAAALKEQGAEELIAASRTFQVDSVVGSDPSTNE